MTDLFLRVLSVGGAVTVILLPLTLGHKWLEERYAAQTRWLLWLGVAAVLLIAPPLPRTVAPLQLEVPAHTVSLDSVITGVTGPVDLHVAELPGKVAATVPASQTTFGGDLDWTELAAAAWLVVAVGLLVVQVARYLWTRRKLMKNSHPLERGEGGQIRVLPGLDSPITLGFLRPVIFLPSGHTDPMALRHEQTHIQRKDVWGKGLLFLVCAFYWFHPLVWLMARQAGRDAEAACDAQLTGTMEFEERRAYGELLLAAAGEVRPLLFATRFGGSKEQMKGRLTQLFHPGKQSRGLVGVLLVVVLLLSGLVACQAEQKAEQPGHPPDGTYYTKVDPSDTSNIVSADSLILDLSTYDRETGTVGEPVGTYTLRIGQTVEVPLDGDSFLSRPEDWPETWEPVSSLYYHYYSVEAVPGLDSMNQMVIDVEDGEIVSVTWLQPIRVEAHELEVPSAEAGLQMTLTGEIPFIDSETGTAQFIFALTEYDGQPVAVYRYTILDMDDDGVNELLLWLKNGEDKNSQANLILHWEDGLMYSYPLEDLPSGAEWYDFDDVDLH